MAYREREGQVSLVASRKRNEAEHMSKRPASFFEKGVVVFFALICLYGAVRLGCEMWDKDTQNREQQEEIFLTEQVVKGY